MNTSIRLKYKNKAKKGNKNEEKEKVTNRIYNIIIFFRIQIILIQLIQIIIIKI